MNLFRSDHDCTDFLGGLERSLPRSGTRCLAWALLPNHVHLLLRSGPFGLSPTMASLNTGYALRFNSRHDRVGHVFQNRYRSRPVLDDTDLLGVGLYVLGNPLKHGVIDTASELELHPWSGYGAMVGARRAEPFHDIEEGLAIFGRDAPSARRRLRDLMGTRLEAFAVPNDASASLPEELPTDIDDLIAAVCTDCGVDRRELAAGRRTREISRARARIARSAVERGWSLADLAPRLGVSPQALSYALRRTRRSDTVS